jgi:hypothetical protein
MRKERVMARLKKLIHEGENAAEVEVELVESEDAWSPYLTLEDAEKLDQAREALRRNNSQTISRS